MSSGDPTAPSFALVAEHRLHREALATLLAVRTPFRPQGLHRSAADLLVAWTAAPADIVLVDLDDRPWLDVEVIRAAGVRCKLGILCSEPSAGLLDLAAEAAADCVLVKDEDAEAIAATLSHVLEGHLVIPARWRHRRAERRDAAAPPLRKRQREVLELLSRGMSTDEIAGALEISPHTVKFHLRELYWRLGVRNRVEATRHLVGRPVA
jgi:two-component system nitrate/nitrite response regulator NarL